MTNSNLATPGGLRKMKLDEFDKLLDLMEVAFADDATREGRNLRADMNGVLKMLPAFKVLSKLWPSAEDRFTTFVWEIDHRFVSAVTISQQGGDKQRWYIYNVSTHPQYRGRGLAHTLVQAAIMHIRVRGGKRVLLDVHAGNTAAYQLYRRLGFAQLEISTTLKGSTQRLSISKGDYRLRLLSPADWPLRYELEQRLASDATKTVCPPTPAQFKSGGMARLIETLIGRAQHIERAQWLAERSGQPIGVIDCLIHRAGDNPHSVHLTIDPAQADVAPALLIHALNTCAAQRADRTAYPMLIHVSDPSPVDWLERHGFEVIETMHQLGIRLSQKEQAA